MPKDSSGKFHFNTQQAMAADKHGASKTKPTKAEPAADGGNPQPEAKDDGDVASHLSALHAASGGKHMHVHDDGLGSITSHHVGEDGEVQGPHSHENLEALKQHMDQFLDEEGHEGSGSGDSDENGASYHNLSGL